MLDYMVDIVETGLWYNGRLPCGSTWFSKGLVHI